MLLTAAAVQRSTDRDPHVRILPSDGIVRVEAAPLFSARDGEHIHDLIARLFRLHFVQLIEVDRGRFAIAIHYDSSAFPAETALRTFAEALDIPRYESRLNHSLKRIPGPVRRVERRGRASEGPLPIASEVLTEEFVIRCDPGDSRLTVPSSPAAVQRPLRRLLDLTLGGASFGMSVIGIMTPFVPTMPFVLATGYFLARASPRLHGLFRRSPLFGEMLCDWEELGGWRLRTKLKLFALMACAWGLTLAFLGVSMPLVLSMGIVSSISVVMILRVPTVSENRPAAKLIPATA